MLDILVSSLVSNLTSCWKETFATSFDSIGEHSNWIYIEPNLPSEPDKSY